MPTQLNLPTKTSLISRQNLSHTNKREEKVVCTVGNLVSVYRKVVHRKLVEPIENMSSWKGKCMFYDSSRLNYSWEIHILGPGDHPPSICH